MSIKNYGQFQKNIFLRIFSKNVGNFQKLAHVIASGAKQSRGKRHNVNSNSGLLPASFLAVRNDVSEFSEVPLILFAFVILCEYPL